MLHQYNTRQKSRNSKSIYTICKMRACARIYVYSAHIMTNHPETNYEIARSIYKYAFFNDVRKRWKRIFRLNSFIIHSLQSLGMHKLHLFFTMVCAHAATLANDLNMNVQYSIYFSFDDLFTAKHHIYCCSFLSLSFFVIK